MSNKEVKVHRHVMELSCRVSSQINIDMDHVVNPQFKSRIIGQLLCLDISVHKRLVYNMKFVGNSAFYSLLRECNKSEQLCVQDEDYISNVTRRKRSFSYVTKTKLNVAEISVVFCCCCFVAWANWDTETLYPYLVAIMSCS